MTTAKVTAEFSPAARGCPVLAGFDPLSDEVVENPYPWLARAREEVPVFYLPDYDLWCIARYKDVQAILRDPVAYSSEPATGICPAVPAEAADLLPDGWPFHPNIASTDLPDHTRLRKLAQKAFTTGQANAKEAEITKLVHETIDAFVQDKQTDLATQFSKRIPVQVVSPIFGVPPETGLKLHAWALQLAELIGNPRLTHDELMTYAEGQASFSRYVHELVEERRRNPGDENDLLTALIRATGDAGEPALTNHEITSLVHVGITAGSHTAATAINHAVYTMLNERSLWDELVADPSLAAAACEETLRMLSPSRGIFRKTTRDVEIRGVAIPEGATIYLMLGSTGRDTEMFDSPDRFDLHRSNVKQHLGFGLATHFCLGAPLSRVEIRVALRALAERIPTLRLSPAQHRTYMNSMRVPSVLSGLLVEWD